MTGEKQLTSLFQKDQTAGRTRARVVDGGMEGGARDSRRAEGPRERGGGRRGVYMSLLGEATAASTSSTVQPAEPTTKLSATATHPTIVPRGLSLVLFPFISFILSLSFALSLSRS